MTKNEKLERGRNLFGILSAIFGVAGFITEQWWLTSIGLGCAFAWLVLCITTVNRWIDDEADRIAPRPRHRRNK